MIQKKGLVISIVDNGFIILDSNDKDERFNGKVHINSTVAHIMDLLRDDLSYEELINKLNDTYDTSKSTIEEDVIEPIKQLMKIGFITKTDKDA